MSELEGVLRGCLDQSSVHASEFRLKQLSDHPDFTQQLLMLVPNQENNLLIMVLTTLKNYLQARYNAPEGALGALQKEMLRNNILELYYQIKNNRNAVEIYRKVLYIIIAVDYPWPGVDQYLMNELGGSIEAGVLFCRQIAKVNEWFEGGDRQTVEVFISNYFPRLEQIVEQILSNFNEATSKLLEEILKTFYSSFHISIPHYLRNYQHFQRWLMMFNTILSVPTQMVSAKSQEIVAWIFLKLFSLYCNQVQDGKEYKGWAQGFRQRYAGKLLEYTYQLVAARKGNQGILSSLVNCLHEVVKKAQLRGLLSSEQIQNLFYGGVLLPLCESSRDELNLFAGDEVEYVRRQDDLTCYPIRRAVLDLIEMSVNFLSFNGKAELMRMVQYCASVLGAQGSSDGEREVVVCVLTKIGKIILRNKYLKSQFQNLTVRFFQPLLRVPNKLLNSLVCGLLSMYLPFGDLSPQVVTSLMEQIYEKIIGEGSLVVRYNAILAFTALLSHGSALDAARPHFQAILQIYVKTLNSFDHENLIECLSSIVKHFNTQIIGFAPDLLPHLLRMFCSLAKNDQQQGDDESDTNSPASASLSTIKQILNCSLAPEVYITISIDLTELLRGILGQYNQFFEEVLSLYAVLCYRSRSIADYQYPYAICRKLLQGDNSILQRSAVNGELLGELLKVEKVDNEYEQTLVSILKNIIQKAPDQVLRNYPWPRHPELILALIQNQRISSQELGSLNTSEVDAIWTPYLSAYSWVVYGVGGLSGLREVSSIVGVSLFPWLKEGLNADIVRLIVNSIEDGEDDQLFEEQNTAQMLQKYANEDDDEEEEYFASSGKNYGFLYDSPFDSAKDREMLIAQVRGLHQQAAIDLVNSLSSKCKKKLEVLMSEQSQ